MFYAMFVKNLIHKVFKKRCSIAILCMLSSSVVSDSSELQMRWAQCVYALSGVSL